MDRKLRKEKREKEEAEAKKLYEDRMQEINKLQDEDEK